MVSAVHVAAYVAAALLLLSVGSGIWARRGERPVVAVSLVAIVAGGAWWSLADAVIATGVGGPIAGIAAAATFPAIGVIVAAFLCLARSASSTDWAPTRRLLVLLAVEPFLATVVVATNPVHLLFYGGPGATTLTTPNEWQHGPVFWVHTVYSYGVVAIALGLVLLGWWRLPRVFGRQFRSLLVASLAPILVVVVDLVGVAGDFGDPTPLGLAVTAVVLHYSIRRQDLIGLAPIARQALFERISDLVVAINPRGRVIDANPAAQALWRDATGGDEGSLIGQATTEVLQALHAEPADPTTTMVLDGDGGTLDLTVDVAGRHADLEIRASRLTDRRGHPIGWVLVGRDVTEVNARNRQLLSQLDLIEGLHRDLAELANRDPLTHLHNRRYGMEWLVPLLAGRDPGDVVCVLMIDIDDFKLVNDRCGHVAGDAVLVAMSRRLVTVMPAAALIARWGGDEFVVAMPVVDRSAGEACAERLRALCESQTLVDGGLRVRWTVSVGVATFPASGRSAAELLEAADLALYAAKVGGRNRVCRHEAGLPVAGGLGSPREVVPVADPAP